MASPTQYEGVLEMMAADGADLSKPAHILFYLYFPDRKESKAAAAQLVAEGYKAESARAPTDFLWQRLFGPKSYSCIAETRMVPSNSNLNSAIDRMEIIAMRYNGEYDGWEANAEK